ncbi:MAG: Glu/Leu/Phe/Val dehydrogenase dimerization domain-containing protein, partial [Acidimicrobiia bacterium]
HDTTLGPAAGGTRMKVYPSPAEGLADAMRLAEGMTYKWAGVGMDQGGGKAVIALERPPLAAQLSDVFARYGRLLESLNGAFATGPDVGMGPDRMAMVARHTRWVVGAVDGDAPDPGIFTAHGVAAGIEAAVGVVQGRGLAGVSVLVQGLGDVGAPLVDELARRGADLLVADLDPQRSAAAQARWNATPVDADHVYDTECDVYAPCALGGTLDADVISRLRCAIVAGSANNQFSTTEDPARAHDTGIVVVPDYIINAGGAFAVTRMSQGVRDVEVLMQEVGGIGPRVAEILADASADHVPPLVAAQRRVDRLLAERGSPRYR